MFSDNVNHPVGGSTLSKKTGWQEKCESESTISEIIKSQRIWNNVVGCEACIGKWN